MTLPEPLFRSLFLGGFECSAHRRLRDGARLDLIAATSHDRFARQDYERLHGLGVRAARDGIRWHLIEAGAPNKYDWSSVLPMVRAAHDTGTQIVWDLCHYGWPDDLDVFSPAFVARFADLSRAFTRLLVDETGETPYLAPVNEASYVAWAGGGAAIFPPFVTGRGHELKMQLARAAIASTQAIWEACSHARVFHIDPVCSVVADPEASFDEIRTAESYRTSQFEVWDMISGRLHPELGGDPKFLDVIGVNYYRDNQWVYPGDVNASTTIGPEHPYYRPVWTLLAEIHDRYQRPLFVAETGIENEARAGWLAHIGDEVRRALAAHVPIQGVCLYPILNHLGWEDDRHCHNGLWDYQVGDDGSREVYQPLADELRRQIRLFEAVRRET